MRRIHVTVDNPYTEIQGLLYLAQTFDELLFDHSDDSYKAPALNTHARVLEFVDVTIAADEAGLAEDTLRPFLEELEWSFANDPAFDPGVRDLARNHIARIAGALKETDRLIAAANALRYTIENYFERLKDRLTQLVLLTPHEKRAIYALAAAFCVQVEQEGFSRRYAYYMNQRDLVGKLQSKGKISPSAVLKRFFGRFDYDWTSWNVMFIGDALFGEFESLSAPYQLSISLGGPNFKVPGSMTDEFVAGQHDNERFLTFRDVKARDPVTARDEAEHLLESFVASVRFFCHDVTLTIREACLVEAAEKGFCVPIRDRPDPMLCGRQSKRPFPSGAIQELTEVVAGHHFTNFSTRQFVNALEYHKAALEASVPENQLVDLWAALEGLLPQPGRQVPRISFFVAGLVAPLVLTYPEKLFRKAAEELNDEDVEVRRLVGEVAVGSDWFSKVVHLVLTKELEPDRKVLASHLDRNPLLRFRLWELSEKFRSRKRILATLQQHRRKILWHVHRIYATRNSIMHSARSPSYLGTLVEHLHAYLDVLMTVLARVAIDARVRISVDTALELLLTHEVQRFRELEPSGGADDEDCGPYNTFRLVFGDSNIVAPKTSGTG